MLNLSPIIFDQFFSPNLEDESDFLSSKSECHNKGRVPFHFLLLRRLRINRYLTCVSDSLIDGADQPRPQTSKFNTKLDKKIIDEDFLIRQQQRQIKTTNRTT